MILREAASAIRTALQQHALMTAAKVDVDFGKFGTMPSMTPCVWIYIDPEPGTTSQKGSVIRKSKFTFFACAGGEDNPIYSALDAIELCEKVEKIVNEISDVMIQQNAEPVKFDGYYSDFAAAYVEFNVVYDSTQQ